MFLLFCRRSPHSWHVPASFSFPFLSDWEPTLSESIKRFVIYPSYFSDVQFKSFGRGNLPQAQPNSPHKFWRRVVSFSAPFAPPRRTHPTQLPSICTFACARRRWVLSPTRNLRRSWYFSEMIKVWIRSIFPKSKHYDTPKNRNCCAVPCARSKLAAQILDLKFKPL